MFNRIRVVTLLIMVLGVFALLQFVSGGLFFFFFTPQSGKFCHLE